eukprot:gene8628-biopygen19655
MNGESTSVSTSTSPSPLAVSKVLATRGGARYAVAQPDLAGLAGQRQVTGGPPMTNRRRTNGGRVAGQRPVAGLLARRGLWQIEDCSQWWACGPDCGQFLLGLWAVLRPGTRKSCRRCFDHPKICELSRSKRSKQHSFEGGRGA